MYVVIEGIDTAGKSSQLNLLATKYPKAIITKEPGGTQIGQRLRKMVLNGETKSSIAEMFIFLADRAEHIEEIILQNKDKMIISDRSMISGIAYANNFEIKKMIELNLMATNNTLPSHVIFLKLTAKELEYRLSKKKNDFIESRGIKYLLDIQDRMIETISQLNINHFIIDASLEIKKYRKPNRGFFK